VAGFFDKDEVSPIQSLREEGGSPYVFVADHAGRRLPRALGSLGLLETDLASHIAWDIGIAGVTERLAVTLDAPFVSQSYSRLAIDCNRAVGAPDSIVALSGGIPIPGNQSISAAGAEARARHIFHPYHDHIRGVLDRRKRGAQPTILVAMHSFTPAFMGIVRPWHVGILHGRDSRLAELLLELLRREPGLIVGDNEPYSAGDGSDFTIVEHGEGRGLPHVEIEIRQDLIVDEAGQIEWAERFAGLLRRASGRFPR
jgi:predicted N-formylglutamate amidohydrolase